MSVKNIMIHLAIKSHINSETQASAVCMSVYNRIPINEYEDTVTESKLVV